MGENQEIFTEMEISAIGEILNISMGSAATAVSKLLDRRVNITTPEVMVLKASEIEIMEAVGVEITYVEGISGSNVMVMKKTDVNVIINIMSGGMLGTDPDAEVDEMGLSAICEVMNQMMGASATALSDFLGRTVNISTPMPVEVTPNVPFVKNDPDEDMVRVNFVFDIEDVVHSKFLSVMSCDLARDLISSVMGDALEETAPEISQEQPQAAAQAAPQPQAAAPNPPQAAPQAPNPPPRRQPAPAKVIATQPIEYSETRPVELQSFDDAESYFWDTEIPENLDLIRSVPLEISVEIGKATRQVKDILEFTQGTIIELDKQAGASADIIVNGQPIAKGDIVVIGDNFGVRIVEILRREELLKL